jgi:hypothetical protein
MRVQISRFWAPKAGNSVSEYEDAFWIPKEPTVDSPSVAIAAADGATETSFAALWARLLASSYGRRKLDGDRFDKRVKRCRRIWKKAVGAKSLPWYAEEKLRSGAFSSIVGVTLHDGVFWRRRSGTWTAVAIGDSCLFQISRNELLKAFPLGASSDFSSRPVLLGSVAPESDSTEAVPVCVQGNWRSGDMFYLMTDALACWFLKQVEFGKDASIVLSGVADQSSFEALVTAERKQMELEGAPSLRNDDVTLVICEIL